MKVIAYYIGLGLAVLGMGVLGVITMLPFKPLIASIHHPVWLFLGGFGAMWAMLSLTHKIESQLKKNVGRLLYFMIPFVIGAAGGIVWILGDANNDRWAMFIFIGQLLSVVIFLWPKSSSKKAKPNKLILCNIQ